MNKLKNYKTTLFVILINLTTNIINAQEKKLIENTDLKIENILSEKKKNNASITINDKFKIQIFFGPIDEAKKQLQIFKKEFKLLDGTILFSNPNYKVWVGSFKNKIEAERELIKIKNKYPNAIIINPNKR